MGSIESFRGGRWLVGAAQLMTIIAEDLAGGADDSDH